MPADPLPAPPPEETPRTLAERGGVAVSALVPAMIAALQLDLYPTGGRDAGVVRVVGLGYAGGFRALDVWLAGLFAGLPLGTRTLRAELPGVLLLALASALLFVVVRRVLAHAVSPAWCNLVAAVATATASFSYPLQREASAPASCLVGVVLVLAALAIVRAHSAPSFPHLAGLSTLGLTYDPAVGVCVVVAALVGVLVRRAPRGTRTRVRRTQLVEAILSGVAGFVPFVLATLHAPVTQLSTSARAFTLPSSRPAAALAVPWLLSARHAIGFLRVDLGDVLLLLAAAGFIRALLTPTGRRAALPLASVTVVACALLALSLRSGAPDPWTGGNPAGLCAVAGIVAFAGVAMHEAVVRVARARLPLAAASASMVVVLEAAFPAVLLDDGLTRAHPPGPATLPLATWEDTAFAGLPGGTLVIVSAPRLFTRLLATEATGDLPGDVTLIPTFDPSNEAAGAALARDERLVPLFRDIVLSGVPAELSMSTLSTVKPLAVASDPRWERTLTRHVIPAGLLALFEPEPRGGADRKRALEATAPSRARLEKALGLPGAPRDAPLAALTTSLLFDRALTAVGTGEREVALRALSDVAAFAPKDPRVAKLTAAVENAKGPVDVHVLAGEGLAAEAP